MARTRYTGMVLVRLLRPPPEYTEGPRSIQGQDIGMFWKSEVFVDLDRAGVGSCSGLDRHDGALAGPCLACRSLGTQRGLGKPYETSIQITAPFCVEVVYVLRWIPELVEYPYETAIQVTAPGRVEREHLVGGGTGGRGSGHDDRRLQNVHQGEREESVELDG
ncbi:hypothetical protein C8R44DRAFT_745545 [Mycena epipterygia]|nr:hypothetical protein C8R44DRAFT_745545 [Mycena epipterygia]